MKLPRYAPDHEFPRYAFVPGCHPHPNRDPKGHSYGQPEAQVSYTNSAEWTHNKEYLWGLDLYNHGYLWEAHEAWEGPWLLCRDKDTLQAAFLQSLIQLTAAMLKIAMKQPSGLQKLVSSALARLEQFGGDLGETYMGLDIARVIEDFRAFASLAQHVTEDRPRLLVNARDFQASTSPSRPPIHQQSD